MCENSSSMELTPISRSICSRSAGDLGRYLTRIGSFAQWLIDSLGREVLWLSRLQNEPMSRLVNGSIVPRLFGDELFVIGGGEQPVGLGGIFQLDPRHPGGVGVAVDLFGRGRQLLIHRQHLAGDRRIDLGD